jgi:hypothetical protein
MHTRETTRRPAHPTWDVVDNAGAIVGTVALTRLGRQGREFYDARAVDGCDLGAHPKWEDAVAEVAADAEAGCPRSPRNPGQRHRPLYDGPDAVYSVNRLSGAPGRSASDVGAV